MAIHIRMIIVYNMFGKNLPKQRLDPLITSLRQLVLPISLDEAACPLQRDGQTPKQQGLIILH